MVKGILLDLDGTVYCGNTPVSGAKRFINRLIEEHIQYLFVTNRANWTIDDINTRLLKMGIPSTPEQIVTSSIATAECLEPSPVFVIGQEGLLSALQKKGFTFSENNPRYVIVSLDISLTYEKLEKACLLIRGGAEFIATNTDCFVHSEKGISPGTGSIVAALKAATQKEPFVIGKPNPPMMQMALSRLGLESDEVLMIGDNPETDILAGNKMGMKTVLILTGAIKRENIPSHIKADWVVLSYQDLESNLFKI